MKRAGAGAATTTTTAATTTGDNVYSWSHRLLSRWRYLGPKSR